MEFIRLWEEEGVTIPEPYKRNLKVLFAPDKHNVEEISFNQALIYPHSRTDYHKHDRPELILILSGRGYSVCDDKRTELEPEVGMWVRKGEMHKIVNISDETMKLCTVFIPPYTSEQLYGSCLATAKKADEDQKNG